MKHTDFVYVDFDENGNTLTHIGDEEKSFLAYELHEVGLPEDWQEELNKFQPGHYRITYESDTEHEYCDGYIAYSYEVIVGMFELQKSPKAFFVDLYYQFHFYKSEFLSLFQKCWCVEEDDTCIGHGVYKMYLWEAIWLRCTWWTSLNEHRRWWSSDQRHLINLRIRRSWI